MKNFFRKVGRFFKRNAYALAVCGCVILVLTMVSITAASLINSSNQQSENPPVNSDQNIPSVPSDSSEVIVFGLPIADANVSKSYAEDHLLEDLTIGGWQTHQGIDFKASAGTSVVAVYDGVVESVENSMMDGLVVTIRHANNLKSVYRCLDTDAMVQANDKVTKGQEIGKVSTNLTEKGDGAHLHFELLENDKLIDPTPYFDENGK